MNKDQLAVLTSSEDLEKLVAVAFGVEGRAVMVQQPTGQMIITRSGFRILSSIFSDPDPNKPAQSIFVDSAKKIHESMGDGVKSFIILTSALLKYSVALKNPVQVTRQLSALQLRLSCFQSQCPELPHVDDHILKQQIKCFETIVHTFFSTRFPMPVSIVLAPLLCQWTVCNTSSNKYPYAYQNLENLLKHFSYLCQYEEGGSRPVAESSIKCGFRVHRRVFNLPEEGLRRIKLVMLGDSGLAGSGCFDVIDIKSELDRFIIELESERDSANIEKVLLVTSAILSDLILFRLKCLNVAVLEGVPPEELIFISLLLFNLEKETGAIIINVKAEIEYGEQYTRLDFPNIYQLFLRAPTSELATEYACTCQSALKVCLIAASHSDLSNSIPYLMRAGGHFERTLQMKLVQRGGKRTQDPFTCGISSRTELLAWHKQRYNGNKKLFPEDQNLVTNLSCLSLTNSRRHETKSSLDCSCLNKSSCLQYIFSCSDTDTHLNQICDAFSELDVDVTNVIIKALQAFLRKSQFSQDEDCFVESVGLRLCILQHSIGATVTLLRICGVIQTKSKPRF